MSLLLKGDQVSFLTVDDDTTVREVVLDPSLCICHDIHGEIIRGCDFYFVESIFEHMGISASDEDMRKAAFDYYGKDAALCEVLVDLPVRGWKPSCNVTEIRYRRLGRLAADYRHPYAEPQPLFFNKRHGAWKIAHPDHCIANARGFVLP